MVPGDEQCTHCDLLSMKMEFILLLEGRNGPTLNGCSVIKDWGNWTHSPQVRADLLNMLAVRRIVRNFWKKIKKCLLELGLWLTRQESDVFYREKFNIKAPPKRSSLYLTSVCQNPFPTFKYQVWQKPGYVSTTAQVYESKNGTCEQRVWSPLFKMGSIIHLENFIASSN